MSKTVLTWLILILSQLTLLSDGEAQTKLGRRGNEGHGGSTIRDENGNAVNADNYFRKRNYKLPSYYLGKLLLNQEVEKEQTDINNLVKIRSGGKGFEVSINDFEIYMTSKLSGDDVIEDEDGRPTQQATFTYSFTEFSDDYSTHKVRRIIEVLEGSDFAKLNSRNKALLLTHDILHHVSPRGHEVISPFIQNASKMLEIRERQIAGDRRALSKDDYDASVRFQNLLSQFIEGVKVGEERICPRRAKKETYYSYWDGSLTCKLHLSPYGGVMAAPKDYELKNELQTNFVGVSAYVWILPANSTSTDYYISVYPQHNQLEEFIDLQNNTFIDSYTGILFTDSYDVRYVKNGQLSGDLPRPCKTNLFSNVTGVMVLCNGSENELQHITGQGKIPYEIKKTYVMGEEDLKLDGNVVWLRGAKNKIARVSDVGQLRVDSQNTFIRIKMNSGFLFAKNKNNIADLIMTYEEKRSLLETVVDLGSFMTLEQVETKNLLFDDLATHVSIRNSRLWFPWMVISGKDLSVTGLYLQHDKGEKAEINAERTSLSFSEDINYNLTKLKNKTVKIRNVEDFLKKYGMYGEPVSK